MKLSELFQGITIDISHSADAEITGLTFNSKEVRPGYLFLAVKGDKTDGHDFIPDAVSRGAAAVVCERDAAYAPGVVFLKTGMAREIAGCLAKVFYKDPSRSVELTGVTGTNGKTTVVYLTRNIYLKQNIKTGLLGTIEYIIGDRRIPSVLTTPDVLSLNRYISNMRSAGCGACIMEVSSHALEQNRVNGLDFHTGVFTNLSGDHLDYHKDMQNYLRAKKKLFERLKRDSWAVVNGDDPYSVDILKSALCNTAVYGIGNTVDSAAGYKVTARNLKMNASGTSFTVYAPNISEGFRLQTKLIGKHNVYNILAAVTSSLVNGISVDSIREAVLEADTVPGRLEPVGNRSGDPFSVYVDYAHTPDALENTLMALREITKKRIILVFGCGGDRDKNKRPVMGRIAGRLADYTFITTDNPRSEDPEKIIAEIESGFLGGEKKTVPDRMDAIREAVGLCGEGDTLLIAGKGHENYQILKDTVIPFNDKTAVEEAVKDYAASIC